MNLHVNYPPDEVLIESVSFLHLGDEVEVLSAVDVEVGGAVERHEEVGDVGDALDPGRPRALVVHGEAEQLVDVGDPLHRVAHDEDEHDRQRDLRESSLVSRMTRLKLIHVIDRYPCSTYLGKRDLLGVAEHHVCCVRGPRAVLSHQTSQHEGVEHDQEDERDDSHEDQVHPDAVNLKTRGCHSDSSLSMCQERKVVNSIENKTERRALRIETLECSFWCT